jgi:cytochrome c-type protein NapC
LFTGLTDKLCKHIKNPLLIKTAVVAVVIFFTGFFSFFVFESFLHATSGAGFCMTCHEMAVVGEQGWKMSAHYGNSYGVVAECKDCHIPPEFVPMLWTKTRDGAKDVFVHFLGESDPEKMDWAALGKNARKKISDSSCGKCHKNLTPRGAEIKTIMAHRAYLGLKGRKKCLDCHTKEFHSEFKTYLNKSVQFSGEAADAKE